MKIYKHGKFRRKYAYFSCKVCGCEYSEKFKNCATGEKITLRAENQFLVMSRCPECGYSNMRGLDIETS